MAGRLSSSTKAGRLGGSNSSGRLSAAKKPDLDTVEGLTALAKSKGLEIKEPKKPFSGLRKLIGAIGTSNAFMAGLYRGIALPKFDKEKNALQEAGAAAAKSAGGEGTLGFGEVFREQFKPETKVGKAIAGTTGFIADILFDPITYLTFGAGAGAKALKFGGKAITRGGTKLAQTAGKELAEGTVINIARESALGVARTAHREAVEKSLTKLMETTIGGNLTEKTAKEFLEAGLSRGTLSELQRLGPKLIDKGGIKMFGHSIVTSERLGKTLVGKAARRLGETETVQALKKTMGQLWVPNYGKNPELVKIFDQLDVAKRGATRALIKENQQLFKGLNNEQGLTLFRAIHDKKLGLVGTKGEARQAVKTAMKTERLTFADPKLQEISDKLFEGEDALTKRMAREAGISEEDAIKFYVPDIMKDVVAVKEFAAGRNLTQNLKYLEEFEGKIPEEQLLKSPFGAYTQRQIQITSNRLKGDAFDRVANTFGKDGEELFTRVKSPEMMEKLGFKEVTRTTASGKVKAWLPKSIADEVNKLFTKEFGTIDELARISGFDWATGLFKGWVTSLFPGFHIRNITSNQFQMMMKLGIDWNNPMVQAIGASIAIGKNLDKVITTKIGTKMSYGEIRDLIAKNSDFLEQGAFGSTEQMLTTAERSLTGGLGSKAQKFNPLSRQFAPIQAGRKVGTFFESQGKITAAVTSLIEGRPIDEAVKLAEDAMFNYNKLSDFERTIMRRVIPFYTFARKNAELQIKTLATTPGRIATELKFIRGISDTVGEPLTEEDMEGLPSWVLENLGIKAGMNQYGQEQVLTGFGLPIEEFLQRISGNDGIIGNLINTTISSANPIFKFPLEKATGIDFFQDRPIAEISNAGSIKPVVDMFDLVSPKVGEQFRELVGWREYTGKVYAGGKVVGDVPKYKANPFALHLFRNLFVSRVLSTGAFLSSETETDVAKWTRLFTGVRAWSIDQETQKFFNDIQNKEELFNWLVAQGVPLEEFKTYYVPKNK